MLLDVVRRPSAAKASAGRSVWPRRSLRGPAPRSGWRAGLVQSHGAWAWDELRLVADMSFRFEEADDEVEYARRVALELQERHAPRETLAAEALYTEYAAELVDEVLACMTPAKLILTTSTRQDAHPPTPERDAAASVSRGA